MKRNMLIVVMVSMVAVSLVGCAKKEKTSEVKTPNRKAKVEKAEKSSTTKVIEGATGKTHLDAYKNTQGKLDALQKQKNDEAAMFDE